jgi:hypothetical protein
MTAVISYGTWAAVTGHGSVRESITVALGAFVSPTDLSLVEAEFRTAVNATLPSFLRLAGENFVGPVVAPDVTIAGVPLRDGWIDMTALVARVDLLDVAGRALGIMSWSPLP